MELGIGEAHRRSAARRSPFGPQGSPRLKGAERHSRYVCGRMGVTPLGNRLFMIMYKAVCFHSVCETARGDAWLTGFELGQPGWSGSLSVDLVHT
jgi:hypothetical protein